MYQCIKVNMKLKYSEIKKLINAGISRSEIKRLGKLKRLTPRNPIYWIHFQNMSIEDAIFNAKKVTPGTLEYFKYYKGIQNIDEAISVMNNYNKSRAVTKDNLIKRHGVILGTSKWESYCMRQAETNKYEYKSTKYGWTREDFDQFNQERSCTLANFIKRHGEIKGHQRWTEYCNRQSYAGVKLDYFVENYGEVVGRHMYNNMLDKKIKSFGKAARHSKPAQEMCFELLKHIPNDNIVWHANSARGEWKIKTDFVSFTKTYFYDFYDETLGKIIEFNGDYWHANPNKYQSSDFIKYPGKGQIQVKDIWYYDEIKRNIAMVHPNVNSYLVIWESEWYNDRDAVINKCKNFLNV